MNPTSADIEISDDELQTLIDSIVWVDDVPTTTHPDQ